MKKILIFGAGKIGRGFLGQLFYRAGYELWFVDAFKELVDNLNKEKKYRVDIASEHEDQTEYITIGGAYSIDDVIAIGEAIKDVDIIVSSVGANNIQSTTELIKPLLLKRDRNKNFNWLICENASQPAKLIKSILLQDIDNATQEYINNKVGLVETQILRSGMLPDESILQKEPLALRMQDWWTLPLDKDAFVGDIPNIEGFVPKSNFQNELTRKVYTFNGTNGPISYIGWANGFKILHEAALAPNLKEFFKEIQQESAHGLINEFNLDEEEHKKFMALAMKKYTDPALNDQIERNARDLKRKVNIKERLVGPALLCLKHGKKPIAYAKAIAAAYNYDGSNDEGSMEVRNYLKENGIESTIEKFSELPKDHELFKMIVEAFNKKTFIL